MNYNFLLLLFTFHLGTVSSVGAQEMNGTNSLNIGDSLSGFERYGGRINLNNPDFERARLAYFDAANSFLSEGNVERFVEAMTRGAWTHIYQNDYALALAIFDSTLVNYATEVDQATQSKVTLFQFKGWSHFQSGQIRAAYQAYNQMIENINELGVDVHPSLHKGLLYRGMAGRQLGFIGQAKRDFLAVLELPEANLYYKSSAYNSLGLVAKQTGDYASAINYYKYALSIGQELYREADLLALYVNLGILYTKMDEPNEARKYLTDGAEILHRVYGDQLFGIHSAFYNSFADYYSIYGDLDSAAHYARLAISVSQKSKSGKPSDALSQLKLAAIELKLGNHNSASLLLDQIDSVRNGGYQFPASIDTEYYLLRLKLAEDSGLDQQLKIINKAIDDLLPSDKLTPENVDAEVSILDVVKVLQQKARLQKRLFLQRDNIIDLQASLATSSLALDFLIAAYDDLFFGNGKLELHNASNELIENHLEVLELLAQNDQASLSFDEVLDVFELNKSNQLLESIVDAEMFGLTEEANLIELNTIDSKIREAKLNNNDSLLSVLTAQREIVLANIEQEMPAYYAKRFQRMQPDTKKLQEVIGDDALLIEFFVGKDYVFRLTVTGDKTQFAKIGETDHVSSMVNSYLQSIEAHDFTKYANLGSSLLERLIGNNLPNLPENIIIVPDAFISSIPFGTLPIQVGSNYGQTRYLNHEFITQYHYSSTLLIQEKSGSAAPKSFIGYAPMANGQAGTVNRGELESGASGFTMLPATAREVQNASVRMSGEVRLNELATEEDFKFNAQEYRVIHLATHNIIDPFNTNSNALIFADKTGSEEDGLLTLYEVQDMGLSADLVTLSACNTGLGEYIYGEGVMSMARGFLLAGTKNVVTSLWTVNDKSTAQLMEGFYDHQANVEDVALSLTLAKRDYLENADEVFADPYYWGAWVAVGPWEQQRSPATLYIFLAGLAISLIAYKLFRNFG